MSNIIKQLEQEQMKQDVPSFRPGDTVEVKVWVVEGSKKRLQAFVFFYPGDTLLHNMGIFCRLVAINDLHNFL